MLGDDEISGGENHADAKENFHDGCGYCRCSPHLWHIVINTLRNLCVW